MSQEEILMSQKLSLVNKNVYFLYNLVVKKEDAETRELLTKYLVYLDHSYDSKMKEFVNTKSIERIDEKLGNASLEYGVKVAKYQAMSELIRNIYVTLIQFTEKEYEKNEFEALFRKYVSLIPEPERIKNIPIKEMGEELAKQR